MSISELHEAAVDVEADVRAALDAIDPELREDRLKAAIGRLDEITYDLWLRMTEEEE